MGWSLGWDDEHSRHIGYGVPAICDHPGCGAEIDRGMAFACGDKNIDGDEGCGLCFCSKHLYITDRGQLCERCRDGEEPFEPTPDTAEWVNHLLIDESWREWRDENPAEVVRLRATLSTTDEEEKS